MSQGDQFHQHGYDHYLKAPQKTLNRPQTNRKTRGFFQSSTFASVALLAAVLLFVAVIVMTYPSDDDGPRNIPVVKADLRPVKEVPRNPGGMKIPNKKSTILARADQPSLQDEKEKIENLLARHKQEPVVSKQQALANAMQDHPVNEGDTESDKEEMALPREEEAGAIDILVPAKESEGQVKEDKIDTVVAEKPEPDFEVKEPDGDSVLQKIGSTQSDEGVSQSDEFIQMAALAAVAKKPVRAVTKPQSIHAAGQSPETIEFVRSVLGEKQEKSPEKIEPAVGTTSGIVISSGSYFVQLASITNPNRASSEWVKMQKKYDVLKDSEFRVQEASLSNGRFYRIQAGPMSKSSANKICDALKRAKKPGGCLVVK